MPANIRFSTFLLLTLVSSLISVSAFTESSGIPAPTGNTETRYALNLTRAQLEAEILSQQSQGRQMVDIEMGFDGANPEFTAVFQPVQGSIHALIDASSSNYNNWLSANGNRSGRYLDIEHVVEDGEYRFSGVYLEDGSNYARTIRTRRSESAFQSLIAEYSRSNLQLIDIEVGENTTGDTIYSGIWVAGPNQPKTAVYYDLTPTEYQSLLNPLAGRILDFERYRSDHHNNSIRYAVIITTVPSGQWVVSRNASAGHVQTLFNTWADDDTVIIDLDMREGTDNYEIVFGNAVKSLQETDPMQPDINPIPIDDDLAFRIADFEDHDRLNVLGFYGKNLSNQATVGYRENEQFPLASIIKTPIHFRLYKAIADGERSTSQLIPYTESANHRNDWYSGDRSGICSSDGVFCGLGPANFGALYNMAYYARLMMSTSDNAATNVLMDHPNFGVAQLNQDVNEWLADIPGVGQGFSPLVSIADNDRNHIWQGQVRQYPTVESGLTVPPWAFSAMFRTSFASGGQWLLSSGSDLYGDLDDHYWPEPIAQSDLAQGAIRMHDMGVNTATPKAVAALFEAFLEDEIVPSSHMDDALALMDGWNVLNRDAQFPIPDEIYSKGGTQGRWQIPETRVQGDTAMFRIGSDWFTFALLGKHLDYESDEIRDGTIGRFPQIAHAMLKHVAPNLVACSGSTIDLPNRVFGHQGDAAQIEISCTIANSGKVPVNRPFSINALLSSNQIISQSDTQIGSVSVLSLGAESTADIAFTATVPDTLGTGDYYLGISVDGIWPATGNQFNGSIGEYTETRADNTGATNHTIAVVPDLIFAAQFD